MSREAYQYRLISAHGIPLSLVKQHLRIDADDAADDALLAIYIDGAVRYVEGRTRLFFDLAEYRQHFDTFADVMELRGPVRRLIEITYLDADGAWQSLPASNAVYLDTRGYRSTLASTAAWPRLTVRSNAVRVSYVAGFGAYRAENTLDPYGLPARLGGETDPLPDPWENYPAGSELPSDEVLRVPTDLFRAVLLMAGDAYEHREQTIVGTITSQLAQGIDRILQPYMHLRAA